MPQFARAFDATTHKAHHILFVMSTFSDQSQGGFFPPSPPSSTITSPSQNRSTLPPPRAHPLKSGSAKESNFINYVDQSLLNISRRHAKKFSAHFNVGSDEDVANTDVVGRGYESFGEVARDLEELVDVIWVSGTPSLQISYLINISSLLDEYLRSFPFAPRPTFQLLRKLDLAFSSLLQGRNVETREVLPGFEGGGRKVSQTEKVRIRGVVERTRVSVVEVAGKVEESVDDAVPDKMIEDSNQEDFNMSTTEDEGDMSVDGAVEDGRWEMEIARVYERTMVELGEALGGRLV